MPPAHQHLLENQIDAEALNPPHVLDVPYGLHLEVEVDLGRPVGRIDSPSHALHVEPLGAQQHRITLNGGPARMDRDIVLQLELACDAEPSVQIEQDADGAQYVAVSLVPEFEVDVKSPNAADLVFLLDCSGSMAGPSIEQACQALALCLRTLGAGDRFNICRFGSTHEWMCPEPLFYSQRTLEQALAYLDQVQADLGGTEIHHALHDALQRPAQSEGQRQIILLTDGQVADVDAVVALAERHRPHCRIFPLGIGPAVSTHLIESLAQAGGGAAEYVAPGARIEEKVLRTFSRLSSPRLERIEIDWHGATVTAPPQARQVFDGDSLLLLGRIEGPLPERVTLSARSGGVDHHWTMHLDQVTEREDRLISRIWARRTLKALEQGVAPFPAGRKGSHRRLRRHSAKDIAHISKTHGILCGQTTFIAIEQRSEQDKASGQPVLHRIPVMLPAGWGGIDWLADDAAPRFSGRRLLRLSHGKREMWELRDAAPLRVPFTFHHGGIPNEYQEALSPNRLRGPSRPRWRR